MGRQEKIAGFRRARSKILIQVTILISAVVILSGLATFFLLRSSQQNLIDKSVDQLLEMEAANFSSSYDYIIALMVPKYMELFKDMDIQQATAAGARGESSEMQMIINRDIKEMLDAGFLGAERFMLILPPSFLNSNPVVFASNDESLVNTWEIPGYLVSAIDEDAPYVWMEEGIPELNTDNEYLITLGKVESPFIPGLDFAYVGFKPMHDEVAAINAFFDDEVRSASILMAIILSLSIFIILLVVFLLLDRLIRRRITEPIDKLSSSAEEVMQGDLDVEIKVHEDGEFAGIEYAFKEMVDGFRMHIARSVGEEHDKPETKEGTKPAKPSRPIRKRPRLLYEITAIIIVVMLVYGLATFFIIRRTQDNLIDKSIEHVVATEADNFYSSLNYAIQVATPEYEEEFKNTDVMLLIEDMNEKRLSSIQEEVNGSIQAMIDAGFFGLESGFLVVPPSAFLSEALVWASSDESLIYNLEVPDYIISALDEDKPYIFMQEGIPELDLEGEQLITLVQIDNPLNVNIDFAYVLVRSVEEEVTAIKTFYNQERTKSALLLLAIIISSIILMILICFVVLNHLIKKQITEPMQELSNAAEEVMQGDLDIQVNVHAGEELEGLKRAFNEMVGSFRRMIAQSVGEV
jgi:methyl-accepting chemotaxis protein